MIGVASHFSLEKCSAFALDSSGDGDVGKRRRKCHCRKREGLNERGIITFLQMKSSQSLILTADAAVTLTSMGERTL